MAEQNSTTTQQELLSYLFNEIATLSIAANDMVLEAMENSSDIHLFPTEMLLEKIGWLADLGQSKLSSGSLVKGGPEDWMLAPFWHDRKSKESEEASA